MKCGFIHLGMPLTCMAIQRLAMLSASSNATSVQFCVDIFVFTGCFLLDSLLLGGVVCMYLWLSAYVKLYTSMVISVCKSSNCNYCMFNQLQVVVSVYVFLFYTNAHTYPLTHSLHMCRNMP